MKKLVALLLVCFMLASAVMACGTAAPADTDSKTEDSKAEDTQGEESKDDEETEASEENTEAAEEGLVVTDADMTIELWDISTTDTLTEEAYEAFMADYPNITINYEHIVNDNYKQQLVIAMSADECPNAYIHWTGGPMEEYYAAGFCDDLTDLYEKYNEAAYLDSAIAMCTANDGKLIALPYGGMSGTVLYYNKTLFAELGIEAPKTMAELEAVAETVKEAGYIPFALANKSKWTGSLYYMYVVARYGGPEAVAKAYSGEGSFTDEPFVKGAAKIQEWVEKGYFPEGVNSIAADDGMDRQLLYTEKAAMFVALSSAGGNIKKEAPEWYEANLGAVAFPIDEESQAAGIDQTVAVGSAVGNAFSFNTKGDDEMRKALFVLLNKYLASDEYAAKLLETTTKIYPKQGAEATVVDEIPLATWNIFANASNVQLFYDQYLPAAVASVHKDTMTTLFDLSQTPEEICQTLQDAFVAETSK